MRKETIIITTGERSSCLKENKFGGDPKSDCVSVHVGRPESVTVFEGHPHLYTESEVKAERLAGQYEAWELARKIVISEKDGGYDISELRDIFGYGPALTLRNNTFQEAADKVQKWEEEKDKRFNIGDVVKLHWGGEDNRLAVVTWTKPDSILLSVMLDDGNVGDIVKNQCIKIDKRVDAAGLLANLKKMKEEL
jgi:hypothetical protein